MTATVELKATRRADWKPPFPWFGGKSSVADIIWSRLGDVRNYVEPFFGSGAVLFLRPNVGHVETVNDADGFVANFWRAMRFDSDAVAEHADWPVNEADLHARHLWLLGQRERITERLMGDPDFYDAKVAGWWVWGQCCWIGSGWCSGNGCWQSVDGVLTKVSAGRGVSRQVPFLGGAGQGVNRPCHKTANDSLQKYLGSLSLRIRSVRVCCGNWDRVCTSAVTTGIGMTGVFLDPPYTDAANRMESCYAVDSLDVAHLVREWAIANGDNSQMRICLAGYEGEHQMPESWEAVPWKAIGGFSNIAKTATQGKANKHKERLWFSPHCLKPQGGDKCDLF